MEGMSLKEKMESAIGEFNKYRDPEAVARLMSIDGESFKVEFSGPFCRSCGFYDYFEDLKAVLEDIGIDAEIEEVEETDNGGIVKFKIA